MTAPVLSEGVTYSKLLLTRTDGHFDRPSGHFAPLSAQFVEEPPILPWTRAHFGLAHVQLGGRCGQIGLRRP